jgi:hypothetical protein
METNRKTTADSNSDLMQVNNLQQDQTEQSNFVADTMAAPPEPFHTAMKERILIDGTEMGERIRTFDWSKTPIGPIDSWSPALLTTVRIMLANRFPLLLWWGPEYISIYNDAYIPILGKKHPWALGKTVQECWSEIWRILQPLIDTPFKGGPATWNDDIFLEINRHGYIEETHFTKLTTR